MAKQAPTGAVAGATISGALAVVLAYHLKLPTDVAVAWSVLLTGAGSWYGHRTHRRRA